MRACTSSAILGLLFSTVMGCQLVSGLDGLSSEPSSATSGSGGGATAGPTGSTGPGATSSAATGVGGGAGGGAGGSGGAPCAGDCAELVSQSVVPVHVIAANTTHLFWADTAYGDPGLGSIWSYPLSGGVAPVRVVKSATPHSIAADDLNVYWTDNSGTGAVMYASAVGSDQSGTTLQSSISSVSAIAVDAAWVYWVQDQDFEIRRAPKTPMMSSEVIVKEAVNTQDIVLLGLDMLWKGEKGIYRQKVDGSSLELIVSVEASYMRMAADAQYVYWTELDPSGSVLRADLKNVPALPDVLTFGQAYPTKVAAFGGKVVWANDGNNCQSNPVSQVMRMTAGGGSPEVIQAGVTCPSNFVASGASLYWGAGNLIYRMVAEP